MQPADPRVVTLLNEALTIELTVVNGYFLNARMLDNWGLPRLGKVFYDLSIGEMRDADELIERILMFDGHPNVQKLNNIQVGENAVEMLELARQRAARHQDLQQRRQGVPRARRPRDGERLRGHGP